MKITREPAGQRVGMESVRDKCGIIKVDANLKRRARTHVCRVFKLLRDFWVLFEERRTWIEMFYANYILVPVDAYIVYFSYSRLTFSNISYNLKS